MDTYGLKCLASAILETAVVDYRTLKKSGIASRKNGVFHADLKPVYRWVAWDISERHKSKSLEYAIRKLALAIGETNITDELIQIVNSARNGGVPPPRPHFGKMDLEEISTVCSFLNSSRFDQFCEFIRVDPDSVRDGIDRQG